MNVGCTRLLMSLVVGLGLLIWSGPLPAGLVDFEDLTPTEPYSGGGAYWRGPVDDGVEEEGPYGDTLVVGSFTSGGVQFVNRYSLDWGSWSGFSYSTTTDTTTPGFGNQFSAFAGGGAGGSKTYAVGAGYVDMPEGGLLSQDLEKLPYFSLPEGAYVTSMWVTNTAYAALSMRDGDGFTQAFGDGDWFKITAYGVDAAGALLDKTAEFYLADYRFGKSDIVDSWQVWDLDELRGAQRIYFNLSSSDNGDYGMNTPAFFALDNLQYGVVPEPASGFLAALGLLVALPLLVRRQRRAPSAG